MNTRSVILILTAMSCLGVVGALADVPDYVNYQGTLIDTSGNPINGQCNLQFSLYADSVGGSSLWSETHPQVFVTDGFFNLFLGSINPFPDTLFNGQDLWLETTVEGEILIPRTNFGSVPYGLKSKVTDHALQADSAVHAEYADTAGYALDSPPDNDWLTSGDNVYRTTGNVGIGTSSPENKLHIVGSASEPILNVVQYGSFRALRVFSLNACAIWVEYTGNHGMRISDADGHGIYVENAGGDGIHVNNAGDWAGYFNGPGYFSGNVGVGTSSPEERLDVDGTAKMTGFKMPTDADSGYVLTSDSAGVGTWQPAAAVADNGWTISAENIYSSVLGSVGIGTTSPGYKLDVAGEAHATSFPTSSDARLKTNVRQLANVLEKIEKIRGVSFDWNSKYESMGRSSERREIGVIAQEIEAVFPELVSTWGDEGYRAVDFGRLTGVLIEAVKELRAENRALRQRIEALETVRQ